MAAADLVVWGGAATDAQGWNANAADGSTAALSLERGPHGAALRLDFALAGHGAWVIARRELTATLPAHYVMVLTVRGAASAVELQVKLVDPSGANVWWWRRRDFIPSAGGERLLLRKASVEFAWGPASGGEPREIGAVEIGLAASSADGTLYLEEVRIEARDPASAHAEVRAVRASSSLAGSDAELLLGGQRGLWQPDGGDQRPWIELDLAGPCEWGGVVVDFVPGADAPAARLLTSDDGEQWTALAASSAGPGGRRWLRTADGDGRFARVEFASGATPRVARIQIVPLELAVSPARWASAEARRAPRGRYPRHLLGEQAYWAVVGADGDERKGLLSEDGALEVAAESLTLEPFLWTDGALLTWADAERRRALVDGRLPVASVEWELPDLRLSITPCAVGDAGRSLLVARYRVENSGAVVRQVRLLLAMRPFQVNPAWQSLNLVGGIAPITRLARAGGVVTINDAIQVVAVTRADASGAARSEEGLTALGDGGLPADEPVDDPIGLACAVLAFDLTLPAGDGATIAVAVPQHPNTPAPPVELARADAAAWADARLAEAVAYWRTRLAGVPIELPASARAFTDSLRASLGWILVNREGPRIQPGPRCYRRSWIRDGTLTGSALAEMGFGAEARAFLRWYAPFQLADGRIPCAVDRHGVDPVAEHDSHGEFAWGVVEVARLTADEAFLRELWPRVLRAVDAIAALRAERTTDAYHGQASFGLLPESISHEGYSSRPVHAYWDDFFAVRGLAAAADGAAWLGDRAAGERIGALRDAMRADLRASIVQTMARHGIDFLPGSVELGDFDPTSTAAALDPCEEEARLPAAALARTFDRYWEEFDARRRGAAPADAYTPYEVRTAAALLRMGRKAQALELLAWLIDDQRPPAWREWPEVAWRDRRAPRFLGDLPHGWVASSFVRAVRRLLVYEHTDDAILVLAAGVPEAWVREAPGIAVHNLPTRWGPLDYAMCVDDDGRLRLTFGPGRPCPPGGVIIHSPLDAPLRTVAVDGRPQPAFDGRQVHLHAPASEIIFEV